MKELDVFETTAVDVGADRLSCFLAMPPAASAIRSATTTGPVVGGNPTPPIGTPGPLCQGGNSAPARAPVAGAGKSPGFGPVLGE